RMAGAAFIGPAVPLARPHSDRVVHSFHEQLDPSDGWAKYNLHHWLTDYRDFLEFFVGKCFTEPHSTKQIEDAIGWALETTPEVLADHDAGIDLPLGVDFGELCKRVRCPVLVIHGDGDSLRPHAQGAALADATGGSLVTLEGAGHLPQARDPVKVNHLLRDFAVPEPYPARWVRGKSRRRRALFISSPIGLGHAARDAAIADELRTLHPDLEIDWLAQHPV